MTTHEYLQKLGIKPESYIHLAFMIGEVDGDGIANKRFVYHNTPVHTIHDWYNLGMTDPKKRVRSKILDYVILNNEVHDLNWLSGANWNHAIDSHHQMMILVASREDLHKYYGDYYKRTEEYIGKKIIEEIERGNNPWIGKK